jgi:hypothetical protein
LWSAVRVLPSDEELAAEGATIQSLANDFLGHKEARTALPPTWRVVKVRRCFLVGDAKPWAWIETCLGAPGRFLSPIRH